MEPGRRYHSPVRSRRAAETRRRIVDAATAMLSTRPYRRATMVQIATRAGVVVESVHHVGTKQQLLRLALETLRTDPADLVLDLDLDVSSASAQTLGAVVAQVATRVAPWDDETSLLWINGMVEAVDDTEIAELLRAIGRERRALLRAAAEQLGGQGHDDLELTVTRLWLVASPETYRLLRRDEDLSADAYRGWVVNAMCSILDIDCYWH